MVRSRRDEFQICMEILEVLFLSPNPLPITEVLRKVGIKHITGKKILQSMIQIGWLIEMTSRSDDERFGNVYILTETGKSILAVYQQQIRQLFYQLGKK